MYVCMYICKEEALSHSLNLLALSKLSFHRRCSYRQKKLTRSPLSSRIFFDFVSSGVTSALFKISSQPEAWAREAETFGRKFLAATCPIKFDPNIRVMQHENIFRLPNISPFGGHGRRYAISSYQNSVLTRRLGLRLSTPYPHVKQINVNGFEYKPET